MTLALAFLLLLLTVPLFGGKLSRVGEVRIRWIGLAAVAFAVQVVLVTVVPDGDSTVHRILHLATYALAAACLIRNLDLRFVWLVGVGGLLNLIAIAANGGVMPASRGALETAGLDVKSGEFANSDYVEDAHVGFLGDVFAIPGRLAGRQRVQRRRRAHAAGRDPGDSRGGRLAVNRWRTNRAPAIPRITSSAIAVMASGEVRSSRLPPRAV